MDDQISFFNYNFVLNTSYKFTGIANKQKRHIYKEIK